MATPSAFITVQGILHLGAITVNGSAAGVILIPSTTELSTITVSTVADAVELGAGAKLDIGAGASLAATDTSKVTLAAGSELVLADTVSLADTASLVLTAAAGSDGAKITGVGKVNSGATEIVAAQTAGSRLVVV